MGLPEVVTCHTGRQALPVAESNIAPQAVTAPAQLYLLADCLALNTDVCSGCLMSHVSSATWLFSVIRHTFLRVCLAVG